MALLQMRWLRFVEGEMPFGATLLRSVLCTWIQPQGGAPEPGHAVEAQITLQFE